MSPLDRARLALPLAFALLDRGAVAQAHDLVAESTAAACDPIFGPMYWDTRMYADALRGDLSAVRTAGENCLTAAETGDVERRMRACVNVGATFLRLGEDGLAQAQFDRFTKLHAESRLTTFEMFVGSYVAVHHARAGQLAEARAAVEGLLRISEPATIARLSLAVAALTVGRILCDDDLMARASGPDLLEAAFRSQIGSTIGGIAGAYARRLHDRGEHAEAEEVAQARAGRDRDAVRRNGDASRRDGAGRCEAPPRCARRDRADGGYHRIVRGDARAHARDCRPSQRGCSRRARFRGRCACSVRGAAAGIITSRSARSWRATRQPPRAHFGRWVRSSTRAGSSWERSATGERGATARAFLRESGRSPSSSPAVCRTEAVAERLTVSEKTVEKHLTAIYGKLGFRNRSQLAAFVIRKES